VFLSHKAYVNFAGGNKHYLDGTPMLQQKVPCHYCGLTILDYSPIAYCDSCRIKKIKKFTGAVQEVKKSQ
jgi:hypothetical protein